MKNIIKNLIFAFTLIGIFSAGANFALAASPSALTVPPTSTTTSITFKGMFIANGAQTTTMFEYSADQNDLPDGAQGNGTIPSQCQIVQPASATSGPFTCTLSIPTISAGVTYYVRAIASNADGVDYGSIMPIETIPTSSAPSVLTGVPSATSSSITFNGTFIANGAQTTTKFEYSTNLSDLPSGQAGSGIIPSGSPCYVVQPASATSGSFYCTLSVPTITAGVTYYFRAVASNISGVDYGNVTSISTNTSCSNPPTISSVSPNNVNEGSGTTYVNVYGSNFINGTSSAEFDGSARTTNVSSSTSLTMTLTSSDVSSDGTFDISVTNGSGCDSGTVTFTVNNVGGGGGGGGSSNHYPSATTQNVGSVSNSSAILNGSINLNGYIGTAWFEYSTSSNLSTYEKTESLPYNNSLNTTLALAQTINGLSPNTIYYFRAVANNSYGTIRGNIFSFQTLATNVPPVVPNTNGVITTVQATNKTTTSARLNGIFVNQNGASAQGYFQYGKTASMSSATNAINLGTNYSVSFADSVVNLASNTIYYFRAVAIKGGITYNGKILVFQTPKAPVVPVVNNNLAVEEPVVEPAGPSVSETQSSILKITTVTEDVSINDEVDYLITFKNDTVENFENVKITIQLPKEVDFKESNFGKEGDDNVVIFDVGILVPSQVGSMTIKGKINSNAMPKDIIVTTAIMSYNTANSNLKKNEIAYVTNNIAEGSNLAAASLFGNGSFLPSTLLGWLALVLVVLGLSVIGRRLYMTFMVRTAGSKNSDHINNLPM